jgi:hypothetical protein
MILTRQKTVNVLKKKITPYAGAHGFEFTPPVMFQARHFRTAFSMNVKTTLLGCNIQPIFTRTYETIEQYWVPYRHFIGEEINPYPITLGFDLTPFDLASDLFQECKPEAELHHYITFFQKAYEDTVAPFLKTTEDIRWLDTVCNANPLAWKFTPPVIVTCEIKYKQIIIARLAANKRYEDICRAIRHQLETLEATDDFIQKRLALFDSVYNDLKGIPPLENPILTG